VQADFETIAKKYDTTIYVVGSRATGDGRNIGSNLPVGKGAGTRSEIMNPPTRSEVADKIRQLVSGELTRNAASAWACTWLLNGFTVDDRVVWEALELLGAADLISTDRPYLYVDEDFIAALKSLTTEGLS